MKSKILTVIAILAMALSACDDTTENIGMSLTDNIDKLQITTDSFEVQSRSILADSVLSKSSAGYLGRIKDPETGSYITADLTLQLHTLEDYKFPAIANIVSKDQSQNVIADSCDIRIFYDSFFGDSLSTMKLTAYELQRTLEEGLKYYSNFDPEKLGYLRNDGLSQDKTYTLTDLGVTQKVRNGKNYSPNIRINLNQPYTDKDGNTYNNYGTYIMRKYFEHPEYFANSYNFIHNVCPGFHFKMKSGMGCMAYVNTTQLNIHFTYHNPQKDSTYAVTSTFASTEEVLQSSKISNDSKSLQAMLNDNTCTYLKTPAGIFTELTLPVDQILQKHQNDTLNAAKIVLTRVNNNSQSNYGLSVPNYLLMVPKDSLYTFFEKNSLHNNKTSYLVQRDHTTSNNVTTYKNTYTFSNIAGLIRAMGDAKEKGGSNFEALHPNWNKVVLVPVTATTTTNSSGTTVYSKVLNDMSLTSTRLVGGPGNTRDKIRISVIYSKFKGK